MTPVYLFPLRTRRPPGYPTCTNFVVLQRFSDNFVHNCTRHFRTLLVYFANCEMSILWNDAVHLLLQCVCDDRRSPWSLSVMNICSPVRKHCAPFSDTSRVYMFAIECKSLRWISLGLTFSACKTDSRLTPHSRRDLISARSLSQPVTLITWKSSLHQLHQATTYTLLNTTNDSSGTMKQLRGLYAQTFFTFRTTLLYLVTLKQCERNPLLRSHCYTQQFYIFYSDICSSTIKRNLIVAFRW